MGLLNLETYSPQAGLLNEEQRKNAAMMGWFNTAANLFDASAPQPTGQQATPLQMLGTGMKGFTQGVGDYTQGAVQSNEFQKKLKEQQDRKDWAARIAPQLGQYGMNPEIAVGMTPEEQQAFIAKAIADQREQTGKEKLYGMVTDRNEASQRASDARQAASQSSILDRQREMENLRYENEVKLLGKRSETPVQPKPLPATVFNKQNELLEDIGSTSGTVADISYFKDQIDKGEISLGPISNAYNKTLNMIGLSTDESTKLASFQTSLEKMRNDSLRLNKGVQTEGDAVRAWDELVGNISDKKKTSALLDKIIKMNKRAASIKKEQVGQLRDEYGKEPIDFTPYENVKSAVGGDVEEYDFVNGKLVPRGR